MRGKIDPGLREQAKIKADMPGTETVSQANMPSPEGAKSPDPFGKPGSPGSAAVDSGKRPAAAEGKLGTTGDARGARKAADVSKSDKRFPVKAIVKKDDTLFRMTVRVYGFSNDRVMDFVKKNNPSIRDTRQIEAGSTIVFPPLDESLEEAR